ncbi:hypothetical protein GCM10027072_70520 [Streptomyces bullii]
MVGEADGGLAHTAGRGMNEHRLTLLDLAQRLQCRQRGRPVQHQAKGFKVRPARWDGKHLRGRHRHVLREGAWPGSNNVGANLKWVGDLRTNGNDLAGRFETRHVGRLWSSCVGPMGLHDVRACPRSAITVTEQD